MNWKLFSDNANKKPELSKESSGFLFEFIACNGA
jgi:hypothetical protein